MRIAIAGADGRMGRMLIDAVLESADLTLTVALARAGASCIGNDAAGFLGRDSGIRITSDLAALANADCLIDFTRPAGTLNYLQACLKHHTKCVIGTTGFDEQGKQAIHAASKKIPIVFAPNMSVGVNVTFKLLDMAARLLNSGYDVEILEAHHRNKVDAPSGTALAMGEVVARAWEKKLDDIADWTRHGEIGPRETGRIGFAVLRGGDIVGEHSVFFCGSGERIEISHHASSRATYAQGSLRAARYLARKAFGLFDMQDVLVA